MWKHFAGPVSIRLRTTKPAMSAVILGAVFYFTLGAFAGPALLRSLLAKEAVAQAQVQTFPAAWRLGGNLYMQTAAEYRACCLQIYACAEQRLATILQAGQLAFRKPAVVMDLDETVLDNSAFESFLHQNGLEYSEALWKKYEKDHSDEVNLVPGAKDFIVNAEKKGVTIVYLSNRSEQNRQATIQALARLGINTANINERLLLQQEGESSNKAARREQAALRFNVLLHIGDNLRDFSEEFAVLKLRSQAGPVTLTDIERRFARVDSAQAHWGVDWFILPNPVYGEWEKLLGDSPVLKLRPTKMTLGK